MNSRLSRRTVTVVITRILFHRQINIIKQNSETPASQNYLNLPMSVNYFNAR